MTLRLTAHVKQSFPFGRHNHLWRCGRCSRSGETTLDRRGVRDVQLGEFGDKRAEEPPEVDCENDVSVKPAGSLLQLDPLVTTASYGEAAAARSRGSD
jgi:hypothetical protein